MSDPSPMRRFAGGLLMAVGGTIAGLCGLCTGGFQLYFLAAGLMTASSRSGMGSIILLPLAVGIIPILVGVGLFALGRQLMKPPRP
jgi:hypothetical protein